MNGSEYYKIQYLVVSHWDDYPGMTFPGISGKEKGLATMERIKANLGIKLRLIRVREQVVAEQA